jgi:hypothetical protein
LSGATLAHKIFKLIYWHKKRIATENRRSIRKSHIWLQTMPQPKLWGSMVEDLAEGLKDDSCWWVEPLCAFRTAHEADRVISSICLKPFEIIISVRQMVACTHIFHQQCFDQWAARNAILDTAVLCPLCRKVVRPSPEQSVPPGKPAPAHAAWV